MARCYYADWTHSTYHVGETLGMIGTLGNDGTERSFHLSNWHQSNQVYYAFLYQWKAPLHCQRGWGVHEIHHLLRPLIGPSVEVFYDSLFFKSSFTSLFKNSKKRLSEMLWPMPLCTFTFLLWITLASILGVRRA